jgi:hypothetical protein
MTWTPSPALARAVRAALVQLAAFYPRSLSLAREQSDAAEQWLASYCRAFLDRHVPLETIAEAASQWPAAQGKATPFPAEFAQFAAQLHRARQGVTPSAPRPAAPSLPAVPPHAGAVEAMSQAAYGVLRSWSQVAEAWAVAWEMATTDAMRGSLRAGQLPEDVWLQIVGEVQHGRVAAATGPLRGAVRGTAA